MICSYDETLLHKAQTSMGHMLDTAVSLYGWDLAEFYDMFLNSDYPARIERGESSVIAGMSGHELAYAVISEQKEVGLHDHDLTVDRSREYWIGWSLSYYQWRSSRSFRYINDLVSIPQMYSMYPIYHEMDISQFVDRINEIDGENRRMSFKRLRKYAGLSQKELADKTGIPLRTIQQYEQGQKILAHARADVVVRLSKALYCNIEDLVLNADPGTSYMDQ